MPNFGNCSPELDWDDFAEGIMNRNKFASLPNRVPMKQFFQGVHFTPLAIAETTERVGFAISLGRNCGKP
jgi:hypothetical protein